MSDKVLVIEDDRDLRESLCEALELEGYHVAAVENGAEALDYLQKSEPPCLILLDLMMPVMDGWTFREAMLANPTLAAIPVIVMTAVGPHGRTIPSVPVLHKPLRMDTVVEVVQENCPAAATPP